MATINIGICNDERDKVDKNIEWLYNFNLPLLDKQNVEKPDLVLSNSVETDVNYVYISDFKRYYYCTVETATGGRVILHCDVDVLMSYRDEIRQITATIEKAESTKLANKYYNDGSFNVLEKENIEIINFDRGFDNNGKFILICAGGE